MGLGGGNVDTGRRRTPICTEELFWLSDRSTAFFLSERFPSQLENLKQPEIVVKNSTFQCVCVCVCVYVLWDLNALSVVR